ncbi:exonuclease subunit SbcD [Clostridium thermosuccinogenes]|uniref:exonuclease subunit SbcD n=1 Tax=Clostridium thermosuccinogenes TaxID=84032 RepID=UPI000CCC6373|nr:exonuclease subunit SbcD [Pseudoclostridium thermosuccinogenes]PNT91268.1 hypothetical protein CDQ83_15815 [Pseudoclostridium thermosuccinogenes]
MKILHTADWHLGAYVGPQCDDPMKRMENTIKCLEKLVATAREEKPDIILVAGDIFHQAKVWADRALTEVRVVAKYLNRLADVAQVVVLYGTPNHDGESQFETLQQLTAGVIYITKPEMVTVFTDNINKIQVAGLPGFDKGHFRAQFPGLSVEEENKVFSQQLDIIVQGLSAQVDPNIPSVLMAHHTVIGCELDNGQHVFQTNEIVLSSTTLENSNFDLVCLGHIHKAQRVGNCIKPVYYAGSIDAFTFNDEGHEKGFWIHTIIQRDDDLDYKEVDSGLVYMHDSQSMRLVNSYFFTTPAREFLTLHADQDGITGCMTGENEFRRPCNKVVRILYTCDEATEKALDKKKIERDLYAAGAYYVSEIRPEKIHEVVNKERLSEKLTVEECLYNYVTEKFPENTDAILSLMFEARLIIEKIQAAAPIGGQTGLFLPLEIEVRNYRSYAEEKLSFQDIYFAMVNGRNGAGKSSLFMDAIVDCLYEEPREGDLTGWIRSGEKSGSIIFTFRLGEDIWRVTRTRQRSGKGTLALAKYIEYDGTMEYGRLPVEGWEDHSCERMADTQQKIIDLLGMDADTFRSCVLIMQDQYGRFMEAKPEDRMSVLASLLGLGIYEQLEEESKNTLTEVNRGLKIAKEEVSTLEQDVEQASGLQTELSQKQEQLRTAEATLSMLKQQKDEAAAKVATFQQVLNEKARLLQEAINKETVLREKSGKLDELTKNAAQTKAFLATEVDINKKHEELLKVRQQLAAMDSKAKMLKDKQLQVGRLVTELSGLVMEKSKLERDMQAIQVRLQGAGELQESINVLDGIENTLLSWEESEKKDREYHLKLTEQRIELDKIRQQIDICKRQTAILENANCIDIENAQCGFLKAAKEARSKLGGLSKAEEQLLEIISRLENERSILGYDSNQHQKAKEVVQDYRKIKQQLASLDGDKKLLEVHTNRHTEIINRIALLEDDKSQLNIELNALQQELSGYNDLQARVRMLEQSEQQWQQLPAAKKYLETILPQMDELAKEIEQLQAEIQYNKDKAAELSVQIQDLQKHQDEVQALHRSISDYEATVANYNRQIGSLEEKLAALMQKKDVLEEKRKAVTELAERAARLQILAEAFSQDGIPHQIIRDIIPELETSANEILGQMTGGRMRLEFRTERTLKSNKSKEVATLDIVIIDVDNGELPYLSRSGGQKTRCSLSVIFALAILKASRVGMQLGMLFIDEPTGLDEEGVEGYCTALETIHTMYPEMRIVAISHDERMKARFAQQLYVEVTENGSKVKLL